MTGASLVPVFEDAGVFDAGVKVCGVEVEGGGVIHVGEIHGFISGGGDAAVLVGCGAVGVGFHCCRAGEFGSSCAVSDA